MTIPTTKVASPTSPVIVGSKGTVRGMEVLQDDVGSLIHVKVKLPEGNGFKFGGGRRRGGPKAKAGELLLGNREGAGDDRVGVVHSGEGGFIGILWSGGRRFAEILCSGHDVDGGAEVLWCIHT